MDALKLIEKDSTKAELPKFNIGDTVKVSVTFVKVREKEFRCLKAL